MPTLGYNFAPTFENAETGRRGGSPPVSPQGSIQTLNYQLPARVAGAPGGVSPLQGQQYSGLSQAVLDAVLRTVLGPNELAQLQGSQQRELQNTMPQSMVNSAITPPNPPMGGQPVRGPQFEGYIDSPLPSMPGVPPQRPSDALLAGFMSPEIPSWMEYGGYQTPTNATFLTGAVPPRSKPVIHIGEGPSGGGGGSYA